MVNKTKKGFTIVELVIVIAVIAILAAVLIPTFSNLINKANESADTQLIRNLNSALAMDGEKHETMDDALKAVEDNGGFIVTKVIASVAKNEILWDSENDVFCYLKDGESKPVYIPQTKLTVENPADVAYWRISSKTDDLTGKYSVYYTGDAPESGEIVTSVGFDSGKVEGITSVKYNGSAAGQTVIIRTNSYTTVVTIDAEKDVVKHYDKVGTVEILKVAPSSYHEFGNVLGNLTVIKGRVEIASGADVGTILVSSANAGDVTIDFENGAKVGTVAPTTESAKTDINNSTSIPAESKQDEIVDTTELSKFAGGLGTEASPYLIATAEQFYKIGALSSTSLYYKQVNDITISRATSAINGCYDGGNFSITCNSNDNYGVVFTDLAGHSEFKNIRIVMGKTGVSLLETADWGTSYGADFNNIVFESTESLVTTNCGNFGFILINAIYTNGDSESIPVYNFTNIINNVSLQNAGTCTGFIVGSGPCFNMKTVLNYSNCVNNGQIIGTSSVGFLYGNSTYIASVDESRDVITVADCKNNGRFVSVQDSATVEFAPKLSNLNEKYQLAVGGTFIANNYLKDKIFTVKQDGSNFSITTTDENVSYKLVFNVAATYWKADGTAWTNEDIQNLSDRDVWNVSNGKKYMIDLPIDNTITGDLSTTIKALDKNTAEQNGIIPETFNSNGFAIIEKDGVTYLVFNTSSTTYIDSSVSVLVYAYADGGLEGIQIVQ